MNVISPASLDQLFESLARRGYTIVGPTVVDLTIVYEELDSPSALPIGWTEKQDGGSYRLQRRDDRAHFGFTVGPHSWKKLLFPAERRMWSARRSGPGSIDFELSPEPEPEIRYAFIGARACDLAAIGIQDRVFLHGEYVDDVYRKFRENVFIVAVNCSQSAATCFCVSMDTGPKSTSGFDIALTEIIEGEAHYFTAETGTERGGELLAELNAEEAESAHVQAAESAVARAAGQMGRKMDTAGLKELLYDSYEHPRWDDVAHRCLTCGNCTMVCPTCFCSTAEDVTDVAGDRAERWRRWDSCFTSEFSYLHGGSIRRSARSMYRQWMTHKLATWQDQFGSLGCVGCGRCITWCPVGIDITEEVLVIRTERSGSNGEKLGSRNASRRGELK
jgi:ferredoxin